MPDSRLVGVLDIGKTNIKLLVFDRDGQICDEAATRNASLPGPPYLHLDKRGCVALAARAASCDGRHAGRSDRWW